MTILHVSTEHLMKCRLSDIQRKLKRGKGGTGKQAMKFKHITPLKLSNQLFSPLTFKSKHTIKNYQTSEEGLYQKSRAKNTKTGRSYEGGKVNW